MSYVKLAIYAAVVLAVIGAVTYGISQFEAYGQAQRDAGAQEVRTDALNKGVALGIERDKLDASIKRTAAPPDFCARLGGKWVPNDGPTGGDCN